MTVGKALVEMLSKLSMRNVRIWGNCIGPDYAKQIKDFTRSVRSMVKSLELERERNMTELVSLTRDVKNKQDNLQKKQGELLRKMQEFWKRIDELLAKADGILRGQEESYAILMEQREAIQRLLSNNVEQAPSSSEGGAAYPALGVAFRQLVNAVTQVKVENKSFKDFFDTFKHTLYCLQPLIEEVAEHGRVVHLPKQEVEKLIIEIVNGVELVHKCSKVRKHTNYKNYKYTNNIINLKESLFRLFIELMEQVERTLKEAMDSTNKIEMVNNKVEELWHLFVRQLSECVRISSTEKPTAGVDFNVDGGGAIAAAEFGPSLVCLAKMNQKETNEKLKIQRSSLQ